MKKLLALVLAVIMVMSLMAACGNTDTTGTTGTTAGTTAGSQGTTAGSQGSTAGSTAEFSYPMDTDVVITEWRTQNSNIFNHYGDVGNFDALPLADWLEEATGIKVEYVDDYTDGGIDLERMWNSGEYEDIIGINWNTVYVGGAVAALEDEVIIPLNDVIDKWMPNFKAWMEANPNLAKEAMTDDGIIYMIPNVNSYNDDMTFPCYYRADVLEDLGLEEPTTIEGWYNVFKKVKEETTMTPVMMYIDGMFRYGAFAHAYDVGFNSTQNGFAISNDGEIYYQRNTDLARQFLAEMAKWYKEGLLDPDWSTKAYADQNKDMISGKVFFSCGWLTGAMQSIQVAGKAENPDFMLKCIGAPSVNGEEPTHIYASSNVGGIGCAITTSCENVEVAARLLDYRWSEEGHMLVNYGKEGVSYDMVDGIPTFKADLLDATHADFPGHKESILEGDEKPWVTSESLARFSMGVWPFGMQKGDYYYLQLLTEQCVYDAVAIQRESVKDKCWDNMLPLLNYSYDEGKVVSLAVNDLITHFQEFGTQVINGTVELNDETWAEYVNTCDKLGVPACRLAISSAYERWANR